MKLGTEASSDAIGVKVVPDELIGICNQTERVRKKNDVWIITNFLRIF